MSDSYWIARLRTAASRTSSNSGFLESSSVRARNTPSRSPASVASIPSKHADLDHCLERDRGREDDVAASRLDPRDISSLLDGHPRKRVHELAHRVDA